MHLKLIACQVFTREFEHILARSPHAVDLEIIPMGLHSLGIEMRPHLQDRIDAADPLGYDAVLLGYALCGRGTDGLRAGRTQLVLPRSHDCIGVLMGDRHRYEDYFAQHPGVYYRSPGWVEFQTPDLKLQPAFATQQNRLGEQSSIEEFITDTAKKTVASSSKSSLPSAATTPASPTSPPVSRPTMPAASSRASKPTRTDGPLTKSLARSRSSIVLSMAHGTQATSSLPLPAQSSAPISTTPSSMPPDRQL